MEVPRLIEKISVIEKPVLQIVEVEKHIPVVEEKEIIKEVVIEVPKIEVVKEI